MKAREDRGTKMRNERLISVSPYTARKRTKPTSQTLLPKMPMIQNQPQDENSKVKVFVRVRPFNEKEQTTGCRSVVNVIDNKTLVFDPKVTNEPFFFRGVVQKGRDINKRANKDMLFEFNQVFDESSSNEDVFNSTTKDIVKSIFEGYNCSVFAYGATGAGKTFTMLGTEENPGITFLTIVELLKQVEASDKETVTLGVSYIEVYNENVRDLLHPNADVLQLREEGGRVTIAGLVVEKINSSEHLFSLLHTGNQNRSQHPTDSNSESSRSHAVFQVHVRMEHRGTLKLAKLSMIDLAGSERGSSTGYKGMRFKEGSNINKSLLALGNCINALAEGLKHIPYRDSKLTRILKDSLGGNCQTMMIANISPSSLTFEDSYNTLKYATRAKCIKSKITKNVMNETYSVAHYKKLAEDLTKKIAKLETQSFPDIEEWVIKIRNIMEERLRIYREIISLESQRKLTEWRVEHKADAQSLYDSALSDSQVLNRINTCVVQLKARIDTVKYRLEEYPPALTANVESLNELMKEINKNDKLSRLVQPTIDLYEKQITIEIQEQALEHMYKAIKLNSKQAEIYKATFGCTLPVLQEFYKLLRSFGHINDDISSKYERAVKSIDSIKAVTWSEEEGENDSESKCNLRLSLARLRSVPELPNRGAGGEPCDITNKEFKSTPFKSGPIKSVMPLIKSRTFIKPKPMNKNKENNFKFSTPAPNAPRECVSFSSGFKPSVLSKSLPLRTRPQTNSILNSRSYTKFKPTSARKDPVLKKGMSISGIR